MPADELGEHAAAARGSVRDVDLAEAVGAVEREEDGDVQPPAGGIGPGSAGVSGRATCERGSAGGRPRSARAAVPRQGRCAGRRVVLAWVVPPVAPGRLPPLSRRNREAGESTSPRPLAIPDVSLLGPHDDLGGNPCVVARRRHPRRRACWVTGWQADSRRPRCGCLGETERGGVPGLRGVERAAAVAGDMGNQPEPFVGEPAGGQRWGWQGGARWPKHTPRRTSDDGVECRVNAVVRCAGVT